jgi:hypothetical protein
MRWPFNPSSAATDRSLDEMKLHFGLQRKKILHPMFGPTTQETGSKKLEISSYRIMINLTISLQGQFILNRGESDVQNL